MGDRGRGAGNVSRKVNMKRGLLKTYPFSATSLLFQKINYNKNKGCGGA
jgi:hypothetical protein